MHTMQTYFIDTVVPAAKKGWVQMRPSLSNYH